MYGTGAQDVDEETEETTSTPRTVLVSTLELPNQGATLPSMMSTTVYTREGMSRQRDQLVAVTETTKPRLSTREKRVTDQPPPSTTVTTAQVSPLLTATTRPEASDLIWPGHPDA